MQKISPSDQLSFGRTGKDMKLYLRQTGTNEYGLDTGDAIIPAFIGRSGLIAADQKREGDGATPRGRWPLREVFFRPDRISRPETPLPLTALTPEHGWCDDPAAAAYNRLVSLPVEPSHERLWRDDHAYDVMIPLGYNDNPVIAGRGSAIFFHCLEEGRNHTEGCVAISPDQMQNLLPRISPDSVMIIDP